MKTFPHLWMFPLLMACGGSPTSRVELPAPAGAMSVGSTHEPSTQGGDQGPLVAAPAPARESPVPIAPDDKTTWKVPIGTSPVRGPDTALVTIVELANFQCPFSKRVQETIKRLRETYRDKIRIVWKNEPHPYHARAEPAAELAEFAFKQKGNAGFWEAHDRLFELQPDLADENLEGVARGMGLDVTAAMKAVTSHAFKNIIEADADLAEDLVAAGTPHFFVNGRRIVGAQPFEKFKALIDEQLNAASVLASHGVASKKIYEHIMGTAAPPPPPVRKEVALPTRVVAFKGDAQAKVVIQEFASFQCPFSNRVRATLNEVMVTYGNRAKLIFRQMPLPMHPDSPLAAEASLEAFRQKGSDGFWKMHDLLFDNQDKPLGLRQPALDGYASLIGLDVKAFQLALATHAHQSEVESDLAAANAAGLGGTPAFVINGYFISGAQPFGAFRRAIERALTDAK